MARGQAQAADKQLGVTNAIGSQQIGEAGQLENKLLPGYTSLMNTGYFNPEEEAAATTNEMGATAAPFETAKFGAANRAAATRNASDLTAQQDQLALEQGRAAGGAAATLQQQKMQNQLAGAYGIAGEEAGNRQTADTMYGLGPGTLSARAQGQNPMLEIAKSIIGAAGTAAAGA